LRGEAKHMSRKTLARTGRAAAYGLLTFWAVISLLPLYWVFVTALQTPKAIDIVPPKFYPQNLLDPDSYTELINLFTRHQAWRWILNSAYIAILATSGILLLDSMAGYAFAKKNFPGKNVLFWFIISTMMVPGQVVLVPMFIMIRKLGLFDTHWALILPDLSMVIGVFLMRQFMLNLPSEFIEAAKIDGASEWQIYWKVVLPLSKPALATLGIFTFMNVWNSFLWPIIVLNRNHLFTLPVGLKTLQEANLAQYKLLMSGAAVAAIPMIIVFLAFQSYFIKGLTMGGVKG